jgi:hypothetical protein
MQALPAWQGFPARSCMSGHQQQHTTLFANMQGNPFDEEAPGGSDDFDMEMEPELEQPRPAAKAKAQLKTVMKTIKVSCPVLHCPALSCSSCSPHARLSTAQCVLTARNTAVLSAWPALVVSCRVRQHHPGRRHMLSRMQPAWETSTEQPGRYGRAHPQGRGTQIQHYGCCMVQQQQRAARPILCWLKGGSSCMPSAHTPL